MAFDAILWAKLKSCASLKDGKIPSEQLPSYIDEVIEVSSYSDLPAVGDKSKIYYTLDTHYSYRWGNSCYILINSDNQEDLVTVDQIADFITEAEVDSKLAAIELPDVDISELATKEELQAAIADIEHPTVSLDGYATEAWVKDQNFLTAHQDLSSYAKKEDLSGLATEDFVTQKIQSVEDIIPDTSKFISEIPAEYITETELAKKGYLTEHQSLAGLATEQYVQDAIDGITIPDVSSFLTEIPAEYITADELAKEGFLKEHQSLADYAKSADVEVAIAAATQNLATTQQLATLADAVEIKMDEVPFTEDAIVQATGMGLFVTGENIKNITIRDILIKLLNLSVGGETPSDPEEPSTTITLDNIANSYVSHDNGATFEVVTKDSVITEHGDAGVDLEGVFMDNSGDIGYQFQLAGITEDSVAKIYIDPRYTVTDIQKFNITRHEWQSGDEEAWIWDESPALETLQIDGKETQMRVYTYWLDAFDECGPSRWRFIVNLAS